MTLAYDYPLLGVIWTMFEFFLFFIWILILIRVFADIFRSHDMGGFAKFVWVLFVLLVPFFGALIYILARGDKMAEHAAKDMETQQAAMTAYVRQAAGTSGPADELAQLAQLRDSGAITDAEFQAGKAKILS